MRYAAVLIIALGALLSKSLLPIEAVGQQEQRVIILYKQPVTDQDEDDLERIGARIHYSHDIIQASLNGILGAINAAAKRNRIEAA